MKRVAMVAALALAVTGTLVSCEQKDRGEIATEVATEWVQDGTETITGVLVDLLVAGIPALGAIPNAEVLVAGLVVDQVLDQIDWSYSTPAPDKEALYRVTATAEAEGEIAAAVVGTLPHLPYSLALPFHLLVDTDDRAVEEWSADFSNASVEVTIP